MVIIAIVKRNIIVIIVVRKINVFMNCLLCWMPLSHNANYFIIIDFRYISETVIMIIIDMTNVAIYVNNEQCIPYSRRPFSILYAVSVRG